MKMKTVKKEKLGFERTITHLGESVNSFLNDVSKVRYLEQVCEYCQDLLYDLRVQNLLARVQDPVNNIYSQDPGSDEEEEENPAMLSTPYTTDGEWEYLIDELVMALTSFDSEGNENWSLAYFAGTNDGQPVVWSRGRTSNTTQTYFQVLDCRLPTESEIENRLRQASDLLADVNVTQSEEYAVDELVMVQNRIDMLSNDDMDDDNEVYAGWTPAYFAGFTQGGYPVTWWCGTTSVTTPFPVLEVWKSMRQPTEAELKQFNLGFWFHSFDEKDFR